MSRHGNPSRQNKSVAGYLLGKKGNNIAYICVKKLEEQEISKSDYGKWG